MTAKFSGSCGKLMLQDYNNKQKYQISLQFGAQVLNKRKTWQL